MIGRMMGSAAPSAEILSRDDVRKLITLITSLTPLEDAVAEAIEDLKRREEAVSAREAWVSRRESAIQAALAGFSEEIDHGNHE